MNIDENKPELKDGEILCDACWKVAGQNSERIGWVTFTFKHLKVSTICRECYPKVQDHLNQLQRSGL